jgi:PGF-CTERM protein
MSGKPEVKTISVNATRADKYSIKLKGYYWLADDPSNIKQIESNEVSFTVTGGAVPTPKPPGFESVFAIIGLLAVACLIRRRKKG